MADSPDGAFLEARAQRLFLAQGSFAEKGLLPTATPDRRMLATDIDVLVSEYGSGFHLTRRHVECKAGKYALLDRILWLNGVRTLLGADSSYLIASDVDLAATDFARSLDVELFTAQHLDAWEKSLGISADLWLCRSDLATFDAARTAWNRASSDREDETWRFLRSALAFVEVESWRIFRYRLLNKLLRLIGQLSKHYGSGLDADRELCARYVFSALLVRLSQYVLAICEDSGRVMPVEVENYLTQRLTFGDQDPAQAKDLTGATVEWVRQALKAHQITMPAEIDTTRLHTPPAYRPEFVGLIKRVLDQSQEARYLPLAVERLQFGLDADDTMPRFKAAAGFADTLALLLKAFVARTFKVPPKLTVAVRADLMAAYRTTTAKGRPIASKDATGMTPGKRRSTATATRPRRDTEGKHDTLISSAGKGTVVSPESKIPPSQPNLLGTPGMEKK